MGSFRGLPSEEVTDENSDGGLHSYSCWRTVILVATQLQKALK